MNIWFIIIAVMVLSFLVQSMLTNRFKKYSEVPTSNGMSGRSAGERDVEHHAEK